MTLPKNFISYAEGVEVLLLKDDIKFLEKTLLRAPQELKRHILKEYLDVWRDSMTEIPKARRQNAGRYAANCWLRAKVSV